MGGMDEDIEQAWIWLCCSPLGRYPQIMLRGYYCIIDLPPGTPP